MLLKDLATEDAFEFCRTLIEWYAQQKGHGEATYLEIGCNRGWLTGRIAPLVKHAVGVDIKFFDEWLAIDANNVIFVNESSDDFFDHHSKDELYDIIFLDGSHEAEQVTRDIGNSLDHLTEDGIILVHDTFPPDKAHESPVLCDNAYLAIEHAHIVRGFGLQIFTFPVRFGLTLISPRRQYQP